MAKPYDPKDFYYRKAKKEGLRARSAFKIEEILRRHRLLGRGDAVLDLGAAPGGFLQILAEAVGDRGVAVGVDLEPIRNLGKPWVRTAVVDLLAPEALAQIRALHPGPYRLVTSDMAPKTIGVKVTDEARSLELVRMALTTGEALLARGGAFVAKVFMGGDFPALKRELQARFAEVHVIRPEATREHSFEVYVLGKGFRGGARVVSSSTAQADPAARAGAPATPAKPTPQLELPLPATPAPAARPPPEVISLRSLASSAGTAASVPARAPRAGGAKPGAIRAGAKAGARKPARAAQAKANPKAKRGAQAKANPKAKRVAQARVKPGAVPPRARKPGAARARRR